MNESNQREGKMVCIGHVTEIAGIERTIAHMEADIAFYHSQCRMFENLLKVEQEKLNALQNEPCSCCGGENHD